MLAQSTELRFSFETLLVCMATELPNAKQTWCKRGLYQLFQEWKAEESKYSSYTHSACQQSSLSKLPSVGYRGVRGTLKEMIIGHQFKMQLTPQNVFQAMLCLTIGHSPFWGFWFSLHCFHLCIMILHSPYVYTLLTSRMYSKLDAQKSSAEAGHAMQGRVRSIDVPF